MWQFYSCHRRLWNLSGNMYLCSVTLILKESPDVQMKPPVFQFEPISSCLVTGQHWKEPRSIFFTYSHQGLGSIDVIYPEPSLLQTKWSQLSQPLFIWQVLQALHHLRGLLLDSSMAMCLLLWGAQNWAQHSRCLLVLSRGEGLSHLTCCKTLLNAAQCTIWHLWSKGTPLAWVQLCVHLNLPILS